MHANIPDTLRRSSRVPITVPILVTSLEPGAHFSEICETLIVSAHGCSMRSPMRLEAGVPVHLHSKEGRQTMAQVVDCQPMGSDQQGWRLGARLDEPENFWGLKACPEDWVRLPRLPESTPRQVPRKVAANTEATHQPQNQVAPSLKIVLDKIQKQLSDDHLRAVVADLVQPLQAELADLREKLARGEPKRSRFEVSLSQIPPELEEQLWVRLRQDLGAQTLQQTREQAEQVLGAAKAAIEQKITEAQDEFRPWVAQELQAVEQRAESISADIDDRVRRHLRAGLGEFQQQVVEAGNRLDRRSEELLLALQQRLGEEHDAQRREMQDVQAAVASESSYLQGQIADLGGRVAKLDESARRLESDLDARLTRMASDTVSSAHSELESAADAILKELGTRNAQELGNQLDDACGRLKIIQKGIEASVSELLRTHVAKTLQSFEQNMEKLAQHSVGRWRLALAKDLKSLAVILGEQFRLEGVSDNNESQQPPAE